LLTLANSYTAMLDDGQFAAQVVNDIGLDEEAS